MKTEVRKEHGDWIVFVDDNPQFSFMYREEAEKVRNMIDMLVDVNRMLNDFYGNVKQEDVPVQHQGEYKAVGIMKSRIEQVLTDAGCEL